MKVTSLELSKKLAEAFPEWNNAYFVWFRWGDNPEEISVTPSINIPPHLNKNDYTVAYDLSYILDKLPEGTYIRKNLQFPKKRSRQHKGKYSCVCPPNLAGNNQAYADTAVEAAGMLALKLKENGVL